jgi:pimeloyl-ACP methyl ester carboxylesterase
MSKFKKDGRYEMRSKYALKVVRTGLILGMVFLASCGSYQQVRYARSFDGERIAYHTTGPFGRLPSTLLGTGRAGRGDVTLLFVHGWSCDSRYWREQVPVFEKKYRVVTMDLAGHGKSGHNRKIYSVDSYGQDVKAVIEAIDAKKVIVIGHSMGGEIVVEATRLEPNRVIGIIGADSLHNVEEDINEQMVKQMTDGFKKDFKAAMKTFVGEMLGKDMKPELKKWIIDDMSSAPSDIAINTFEQYVDKLRDRKIAKEFQEIKVPVRCVNADLWPMNIEGNRKYMKSFDVKIMKGAGHFVMLERPEEFNKLLEQSIEEITKMSK